jgi:hypothetical protein
MKLTKEQLQIFAIQGYLVIPRAATCEMVAAANQRVDELIKKEPPKLGHRGFHFYWVNNAASTDPLLNLLTNGEAANVVSDLVAPRPLAAVTSFQVSLIIPPYDHIPGAGHIDGLTPPEESGRPGTFTCLAGIFLTDQSRQDSGNLWVWPGSHRALAEKLRAAGPDAIFQNVHPKFGIRPVQVMGEVGDLLISHYMLAHNMGPNLSSLNRRMAYYRMRTEAHATHWREYVQDELFEFSRCRQALDDH